MKYFIIIICILSANIVTSSNSIQGAFGFNIGTKLNKSKIIKRIALKSGDVTYKVKPIKRIKSISEYYLKTTPSSNLIYRIWGYSKYSNYNDCLKDLSHFDSILTKKYGSPYKKTYTFSTESSYATKATPNRSISVSCENKFTYADFFITYLDFDLLDKSKKEFIELKNKKIDKSAL